MSTGRRELAARARSVKVFVDYNPWDRSTRPEGRSDEAALAELVARIDADGIFRDTLSAASPALRAALDRVRPWAFGAWRMSRPEVRPVIPRDKK